MQQKMKWILLLTSILMDHSFSAVFFLFDERKAEVDYKISRSESVHRGVLLSYSVAKKTQICRDLFSVYHQESTVISDGLKNKGEPQYSLVVKKPRFIMPEADRPDRQQDLCFSCSGKGLTNMKFGRDAINMKFIENDEYEYVVSSAHRRGIMYYSDIVIWNDSEVLANNYLGMSPEYVSLDQMKLEKQYVESREMMRALSAESPAYGRLIERRDNITELSKWQQFLLCSSVILSPQHEEDRQYFPLYWSNYKKKAKKYSSMYKKVCLAFEDAKYQSGDWCTDCLLCGDSSHWSRLLLTRSYDDRDSLYVAIERNGKYFLRQYLKNVPVLINVHVPFTLHSQYVSPIGY